MDDSPASRQFSVTLAGLGASIRSVMERIASRGIGGVQLNAAEPGLRPRELDQSARRDLLATLRRRELSLSGLDLWIPPEHFTDPAHADRAMTAVSQAVTLAADLGRVPVCLTLPRSDDEPADSTITRSIAAAAETQGVMVIDYAAPPVRGDGPIAPGIDPPTLLSRGDDPIQAMLAAGESLGQVRMCDLDRMAARVPIGHSGGRMSVIEFAAALDIAPGGAMPVIDTRGWGEPWAGIEATIARW